MKLLPILLIFLTYSCASVYVPGAVHEPVFQEAGQIELAGQVGTNGLDFQGGYAITDNVFFLGDISSENSDNSQRFVWSLGGGYKHQLSEHFQVSGTGFYSSGSSTNRSQVTIDVGTGPNTITEKVSADYHIYGIQPSFAYTENNVEVAFTPRARYFVGYDVKFDNQPSTWEDNWFIEPTLTVRHGWEKIKFHYQVGASILVNAENDAINYRPLILNIGIQAKLPTRTSKK